MNKSVKKIIILGIFALCFSKIFASGLDKKNSIGIYVIGAEQTIGGIQYEHRFSDIISEKFGIYAFYTNDDYSTTPLDITFTAQTDFTLYKADWNRCISSRLFAYILGGYNGKIVQTYEYTETATTLASSEFQNNAIASAGFGFDFIFFDHLSVPIQFGFMADFPYSPHIGFCGGAALRYSW